MLEVNNLTFAYEKQNILEKLSFTVQKGEIVGLAGPNGSGKTTLIKNVINILDASEGSIMINGISNKEPIVQKKMMYLASDDYLPEFLTGKEYIQLLYRLYNVSPNEALLEKLLGYYSMNELFGQIIDKYSHGTKKKIQLLGAFLIQPDFMIVDETLNGIDMEAREVTKALFHKYIEKDKAILLCTHDFSLVEELRAKAILIHGGEIRYNSSEYYISKQSLREIFCEMVTSGVIAYELD